MTVNKTSWALLPLVLLTSCAAPQPAARPLMALPDSFPPAGQTVLPEPWWEDFQDEALNALIGQALAGNFSLRGAWDRLAQAEALARRAGASLWPSVTGDFEVAGRRSEVRGRQPSERVDQSSYGLGAVMSYEVDVWGRVRSTRDAAALDVLATQEQLQAAAITLSAQVATTWFSLLEQRAQVAVLERQTRVNRDTLEVVTARFRGGQARAADVLRQRQLVESGEGSRVQAEGRVKVLDHQLAILTGQPPGVALDAADRQLPALPELPATGLPAEWVCQRPDLRQAFYQVLAADRRVAAAVANRFPRIGIGASVSTSGEEWRDLFNNWAGTLAANVVAPLFDGGARKAEVELARATVSERLNTYSQSVLTALGEVEDALSSEAYQRQYIASVDEQLALSRQTLERLRDNYLSGAAAFLDILQAQVSQQTLERTQLQARRELLQFRINLCRALSSGWDLPRPEPATLKTAEASTPPS